MREWDIEKISQESIEAAHMAFPDAPPPTLRVIAFAAEFAAYMHRDHKRKGSGDPYFVHPMRVAKAVAPYVRPEGIAASLMHDVPEEVGLEREKVIELVRTLPLFPSRVRDIVRTLTHLPCNTKEHMLERINGTMDTDAILIKIADRTDNLLDGTVALGKRWLKKYAIQGQILYAGATAVGMTHHPLTKKLKRVINASILKASRKRAEKK